MRTVLLLVRVVGCLSLGMSCRIGFYRECRSLGGSMLYCWHSAAS